MPHTEDLETSYLVESWAKHAVFDGIKMMSLAFKTVKKIEFKLELF